MTPLAPPATILVRAGTKITIHLKNARPNEAVTFTPTTVQAVPVDIGLTFLKSAITPLQSVITQQKSDLRLMHVEPAETPPEKQDPILRAFGDLVDEFQDTMGKMSDASVQLSCLEAYRVVTGSPGEFTCTNLPLTASGYGIAKAAAIDSLLKAWNAPLPLVSIKDVEKLMVTHLENTQKEKDTIARRAALKKDDQYKSMDTALGTAMTDTQKVQAVMLESAKQLTILADAPSDSSFTLSRGKDYNASITIVAQEAISKANTTVATVSVNWRQNPWVVSTGIMFSTLAANSFANLPLVEKGQPQVDSSGKNLTIVTQTKTLPTIVVPLVMLNYRVASWSNRDWENRCPGHCAFVLGAGVGLNVQGKAAEYAFGPSFQIGSVLFTGAAHVGRELELTNGLTPGLELGTNPPMPLPTSNNWKVRFGFSVSYILPFQ